MNIVRCTNCSISMIHFSYGLLRDPFSMMSYTGMDEHCALCKLLYEHHPFSLELLGDPFSMMAFTGMDEYCAVYKLLYEHHPFFIWTFRGPIFTQECISIVHCTNF